MPAAESAVDQTEVRQSLEGRYVAEKRMCVPVSIPSSWTFATRSQPAPRCLAASLAVAIRLAPAPTLV